MAMEDKVVDGYVVPTAVKPDGGETPEHSASNLPDPKIWLDLEEALESLHDALPEYDKAEAYYEGTVKEKFLNKAVQALLTGSDTDFNVNLAGRVVDAVQDRMEIAAVTAEPIGDDEEEEDTEEDETSNVVTTASGFAPAGVEEPEEEEMSEEEKLLDEAVSKMWRDNEMDIEAPEVHQKMLMFGDGYLFVGLCDDEDNEDPDRVDFFFNSPKNVRILYEDENPRKKRLAIKRWEIGPKKNKKIRLNLYYRDGTYKFISKGSSDRSGAADFDVFVDDSTDEMGFVPNESGEIPFFHFRTARPYGRPEHKKAYGAQDALTKIITNMMSTTDFAAFPQRWALQETGTTTDDDLDWDEGDNGASADTKNPSDLQSQLISGPGRIWPLRNMKAVGQFQAADVTQFLQPLDKFTGLMAAVTATPVSYFLVTLGAVATAISGESQRKGESPFLSKVNARQLSAEASWQDAVTYGLKLIDLEAEVKVRWAPIQIVSGKEGWEGVQAQQKAGVPVRQTLLEAGYTEAEVTSWGYTEDEPDGSGAAEGLDMSGVPIPGNQFGDSPAGTPLPEVAPTPPAQPAPAEV